MKKPSTDQCYIALDIPSKSPKMISLEMIIPTLMGDPIDRIDIAPTIVTSMQQWGRFGNTDV